MSKICNSYFIMSFKSCSTLFYWDIHQFFFLTWIYLWNLSFSAWDGFNYRLHDHFQLVYMERKFHRGLFKPWWSFNLGYPDTIFEYDCNSIFILLLLDMLGEISSQFNQLAPKKELFAKIFNHFCKRCYLRCLTELWISLYS